MRLTKEELSIRVVVRRVGRGPTPFVWSINKGNMAEPIYISPNGFGSMEAAFRAGQARLSEFIPTKARPGMSDNEFWQSRRTGSTIPDRAADFDDDGHTPANS
jgi:hypothetical protein